jgi:hypothetical protein
MNTSLFRESKMRVAKNISAILRALVAENPDNSIRRVAMSELTEKLSDVRPFSGSQ